MTHRAGTTAPERSNQRLSGGEGQDVMEYWSIWYPKAAATGLLIARGMLDETQSILFHAAPDVITVEVADQDGRRLAYGKDLERTADSPMSRLRRDGPRIVREDFWPTDADTGLPVMLAGGEVGRLEFWWHSDDKKEWRWRVEFYNSTRSAGRNTMASQGP